MRILNILPALIFFIAIFVFKGNAQNAPLSYLALGDSYTIGESVNETQRWPMQLVDTLKRAGISIADPIIIAKTGWTTAELRKFQSWQTTSQ